MQNSKPICMFLFKTNMIMKTKYLLFALGLVPLMGA